MTNLEQYRSLTRYQRRAFYSRNLRKQARSRLRIVSPGFRELPEEEQKQRVFALAVEMASQLPMTGPK